MTALDFLLYTIAFVIGIGPAAIVLLIGLAIVALAILAVWVGIQMLMDEWRRRK